jgi:hypothetical protein
MCPAAEGLLITTWHLAIQWLINCEQEKLLTTTFPEMLALFPFNAETCIYISFRM